MNLIDKCPVCGTSFPEHGLWGELARGIAAGITQPSFGGLMKDVREEDQERVMITFSKGIAIMGHLAHDHGIHLAPEDLTVLLDGEEAVLELITRKLIAK